jgi:O-antigen ligase
MALATWERYPWFGIGMDSYSQVTAERVKVWRRVRQTIYDPANYYQSSHTHSLYVDTLAERGIVGASALSAVLIAWTLLLLLAWRRRPGPDHHGHGLLAALVLGLSLSRVEPAPQICANKLGHCPLGTTKRGI